MKKLLTFFLTALLAFSVGWATTVTYSMGSGSPASWSPGNSTGANQCTTSDGFTIYFSTSNATKTNYIGWNSGSTSTMTVSHASYNITKITATCSNGTASNVSVTSGGGSITSSSSSFTWTASTSVKSVSFNYSSGSQLRISQLVIEYSGTSACAIPTFSPGAGTYTEAQTVTISSATSGATIYYTTDGNDPTTSSSSINNGGTVNISSNCTLKAMAAASGYTNSGVASAAYIIDTSGPFSLVTNASTLTAGDEIIFVSSGSTGSAYAMGDQTTNNRSGVSITVNNGLTVNNAINIETFTLEGSTGAWYFNANKLTTGYLYAASSSSNYLRTETESDDNAKATISITSAGVATITFQGSNSRNLMQYNSSNHIFSCYNSAQQNVYIYRRAGTPKVATPTFTPAAGTYNATQSVTISCDTPGATIYYTTNGDTPTTNSTVFDSNNPISVGSDMTIKAFATLTGYDDSEVAEATYTINLSPTLTALPNPLNINDDNTSGGRTGSFTVTGNNLGTANVGVTRTNTNFTPALSATTGTTYDGVYNGTPYWGFTPAGSLEGTVAMTYNGHALSATTAVTLANAEGANHVSAVVNVNYLYTGNIYIMGYVNENGWAANNGELMDRDESTGNYSKTLTLLDSGDGHAYISFTKALANGADDWNSIAGYRFGPESNGNWTFNENLVNVPCALDTTGGYWSIKIPAGEWVVSINPNTNKFTLVPHVPAPVFDPAGGRYETAQDVEITCTNVDAHIYYTTDGSTPSANNGTLYSGPITVSAESTTIKAIAIYGNASSAVTTATYTIKPIGADDFILVESTDDITAGDEYVLVYTSATGVHHAMSTTFGNNFYEETTDTDEDFTLADGVVTLLQDPSNVNVLTLEEAGNDYFYIKDHDGNYMYYQGSSNNVYRAASNAQTNGYKWQISINGSGDVVINNVGNSNWYLQSNPQNTRYACYKRTQFDAKLYKKGVSSVPAPQITPAGGTSNKRFESIEVTITAAEGCKIYYTTDGTAPSVNSTEYTGVFVLPYGSAPTTVKAIAVDGEGEVSRVTTVVYYWDRVTVSISPASKEVVGNVDVTITPSPSDATVTYTINGGEPQTYNGPFTVQVNEDNTPVTVEATAIKGESTATASVTYTYKDGGVNSIAEFLALDNNEERFFKNPVVVLFDYSQNGNQDYIWVKDRTGYMKLFIQPGFDSSSSKPRYNNGDVIPEGFTVKKITYTEHDASFIEGKSDDPSLENFKNPTERALADPEQVKLSELLTNPDKYNDRYLYINKLKVTGHEGVNYTIVSDENGSIVSGNNVIIYNKFPTWKEKDGTSHTVTIPSGDGKYYNVKFIFQKYGSVYEIMPIEFTEWHENKVRLEDLVEIGVKNNSYTISNELVAVKVTWDDNYKKFAIFAKDDEMYANKRYPADGQEEYLIRYERKDGNKYFINEVPQKDYDQSNWLEILIPSNITSKQDGLYQNQLATLQERYENKILPGGSVQGTYVDVLNPTIEMASEIGGDLKGASYDPNIFFTGNFVMENLGENGAVSYNQANDGTYFMMDAKPQEFCMVVWAYYEGSGNYFIAPEPEGAEINGHGFHGSFLADMSLCEDIYGLESAAVNKGTSVASCFKASDDESYGSQQMLYGFKAIVRKNPDYWNAQGGNGAPSRIQPYSEADGNAKESNPAYKVYPMSVGSSSSGNVTDVNEVNAIKEVVSVRYYNVMGMESEKPFEGINIVVTRYSDGSASTMKVLR